MCPEVARGMVFPPSYFGDRYTPAEEERIEAEQRADEERMDARVLGVELPAVTEEAA